MWTTLFMVLTAFFGSVMGATETYTVAVIEYNPLQTSELSEEDTVDTNAAEYLKLLSTVTEDLELVLFPEATLGGSIGASTEVPLPFSEIICNSSDTTYKEYLKKFSCAAIEYNTTIVVNLIEKENCASNNATGFCPSSGIVYYNSNVAFNNSGGVIGRYRKWNLFGEYSKSPPAEVELVSITTKNNNTFGMFTCFDIMFAQPALNLTRDLGLKNILFPTMWFSELPYLTALQTQQMWAEENDVNFISSGANSPRVGSGGTGIFIGKEGPVAEEIIGSTGGTTIIVRTIPNLEIANNPYINVTPIEEDVDALALDMDDFYLITDPSIGDYTSKILYTNQTNVVEEVCDGDTVELCCEFNIVLSLNETLANSTGNRYTYHLAAFDGIRSYSGVRNGGIESCGVLACLNESIASCGKRFSNYSEVVWPVTFENITVSANFLKDQNRIQFPNSVLASLRPISPQYTLWTREDSDNATRRSLTLTKPQDRLLTFGIFGRDFSRDGELNQPDGNKSTRMSSFGGVILVFAVYLLVRNY